MKGGGLEKGFSAQPPPRGVIFGLPHGVMAPFQHSVFSVSFFSAYHIPSPQRVAGERDTGEVGLYETPDVDSSLTSFSSIGEYTGDCAVLRPAEEPGEYTGEAGLYAGEAGL